MISVSKETAIRGDVHRYFTDVKEESLEHLSGIIATSVWSPIIWTGGMRAKKNFKSAEYLALDFDDGKWDLKAAKKWCKENEYTCIIGTSKSHRKEKTTASGHTQPAVDRFRLVVPFEKPLTDRQLYEYNMRRIMRNIPCDPSCKHGGRFFYPCKEIIYVKEGYTFRPEYKISGDELTEQQVVDIVHTRSSRYAEAGIMPASILMSIKHGTEPGGRHTQCYKIGAELFHYGYDIEQITAIVLRGPLREIGAGDVRRAVSNGWQKAAAEKRELDKAKENRPILKLSRKD